jgi:hypothetical protein
MCKGSIFSGHIAQRAMIILLDQHQTTGFWASLPESIRHSKLLPQIFRQKDYLYSRCGVFCEERSCEVKR